MAITEVILEVAHERDRQAGLHGYTTDHDDAQPPEAWAWLLLRRVTNLACPESVLPSFPEDRRRELVEVAAIAVAAVEAIDRRPIPSEVAAPG